MSFIQSKHSVVVGNAVIVLKQLVQSSLQQGQAIGSSYSSTAIISRLAYSFDNITHPQARACILWLVGQYAADESGQAQNGARVGPEGVAPWAPDLLRKSAITFTQEVSRASLRTPLAI